MKKFTLFLTLIAIVLACFSASYTVFAEEGDNGYVYYAQDKDGVFTAYSVAPLSDNENDVTITTTNPINVKTIYAFNAQYKKGVEGRIYVEIKHNSEGENIRAIKIDGNKVENINATFTEGVVSFYIDQAGTYAIIDITDATINTFSWYHIVLIAGVVKTGQQ